MSDPVSARYKEALQRGHVAVVKGRPHDAVGHYEEAGRLAPDRPLPYARMGQVYLRMEQSREALKAFVNLKEGIAPSEEIKTELAWLARTEIGPDVVFKSIDFKRYLPTTHDKGTLKSLLWADAMHVPAKISITVTD